MRKNSQKNITLEVFRRFYSFMDFVPRAVISLFCRGPLVCIAKTMLHTLNFPLWTLDIWTFMFFNPF